MPRLAPQRFISPEEVAEALQLPDSFVSRDQRLGETWGIGPSLGARDSGYAAKAQEEELLALLNSDPSLADDWDIQRASHWGYGWCEYIIFRVLESTPLGTKEPSRIFRVLLDYQDAVREYGIDSELLQKHCREEIEEYIRSNLGRGMRDDIPEDWVEQLADELERTGAVTEEPSGDIYISRDSAHEAIINLGFQEVEDDEATGP